MYVYAIVIPSDRLPWCTLLPDIAGKRFSIISLSPFPSIFLPSILFKLVKSSKVFKFLASAIYIICFKDVAQRNMYPNLFLYFTLIWRFVLCFLILITFFLLCLDATFHLKGQTVFNTCHIWSYINFSSAYFTSQERCGESIQTRYQYKTCSHWFDNQLVNDNYRNTLVHRDMNH